PAALAAVGLLDHGRDQIVHHRRSHLEPTVRAKPTARNARTTSCLIGQGPVSSAAAHPGTATPVGAAGASGGSVALAVRDELGLDLVGRAVVRVVEPRNAGAGLELERLLVGTGVERQRVAALDRGDLPA